jgi:hypothetical protein
LAPERFFDFRWPERDTDRLEWSNWGMMSSCGSVAWVWLADIMFGLGNCTFGANTKTEPSGMLDCLAADMMRASSLRQQQPEDQLLYRVSCVKSEPPPHHRQRFL